MLASIHAETQSDRVAEGCPKVAERLAVLGGEVKTVSKLTSTLVKTGQCNIPLMGLSLIPLINGVTVRITVHVFWKP